MPKFTNQWEAWKHTIRIPAEQTKEGRRRLDCGSVLAEYQLAPLPEGQWAIWLSCSISFDSGMAFPWQAFPTREEAVEYFRAKALAFFRSQDRLPKEHDRARRKIMDLLELNLLFGFAEPEPQAGT